MSQEYHEVTFHGVQCWYQHAFEKFGWMLLADKYQRKYKVDAYLEDLVQLAAALLEKIYKIGDEDKKKDLRILSEHVKTLQDHARATFKPISNKPVPLSLPQNVQAQVTKQQQQQQQQAKRQSKKQDTA